MNLKIKNNRMLACLALAFLLLFASSPCLFAADTGLTEYSFDRNLQDWYYLHSTYGGLYYNDDLKFTFDFRYLFDTKEITPFQAFLAMILYNSDCPEKYITMANILKWEEAINIELTQDGLEQFIKSSSVLMGFITPKNDGRIIDPFTGKNVESRDKVIFVGLTKQCYDVIMKIHKMFFEVNHIDEVYEPIDSLAYVVSGFDEWYCTPEAMVIPSVEYHSKTMFNADFVVASEILFVTLSEHDLMLSLSSWGTVSRLLKMLDVELYLSWLPPLIASQYLIAFELFLVLISGLAFSKFVRG